MRFVPFIIQFFLLVWALIDCVQSDEDRIRNLPRTAWVFLIILVPFAGPLGWFMAGRPQGQLPAGLRRSPQFQPYEPPRERPRPLAPDDDPEFLARLEKDSAAEHEKLLKQWEDDLRRREEELRAHEGDPQPGDAPERDDRDQNPGGAGRA